MGKPDKHEHTAACAVDRPCADDLDGLPHGVDRPTVPSFRDGDEDPLSGTPWSRMVLGDGGVLCAWDRDGLFHLWGTAEEVAEAVFHDVLVGAADERGAFRAGAVWGYLQGERNDDLTDAGQDAAYDAWRSRGQD